MTSNINDPGTWSDKLITGEILRAADEAIFGDLDVGFCIKCGHEQDDCKLREYVCESCGEHTVYGAAELARALRGVEPDDS